MAAPDRFEAYSIERHKLDLAGHWGNQWNPELLLTI
jgi:hypothetical protein